MKTLTHLSFRPLAAAIVCSLAALPLLWSPPAQACGGLFCDTIPVEQNAERILFEINGDDTVTATVEITYTGSPEGFSWVVPVTDTPTLGVVPQSTLSLLDTGTVPQIIPPPVTCSGQFPGLFGGESDVAMSDGDDDDSEDGNPVDVEDLPVVGPFDPEVVSSTDAGALIDWLNENGYFVTEEMHPYIQDYVSQGMKFLGMKLAPGAGVQDITPIQMTYPGTQPTIPIVLTAVAAEPEMGILTFIAANERYESSNYVNMEMDIEDVQWDPRTSTNNYYPLVSWMIDQAGGKGILTEYAAPSSNAWDQVSSITLAVSDYEESLGYLQNLFSRRSYVTRAYSRVSGPEMDTDPQFRPSTGGDISRTLDLSYRPAIEICAVAPGQDSRVPCGGMYCGEGALCATTRDDFEGCVCPEGTSARTISQPFSPGGGLVETVVCQDATFDLMGSARAEGDGPADACLDYSCGDNGQCVDINGFATCACEDGYAAINLGGGEMTCAEATRTFEPDQLLWNTSGCASSCNAGSGEATGAGILFGLLLLPLVALRRRA